MKPLWLILLFLLLCHSAGQAETESRAYFRSVEGKVAQLIDELDLPPSDRKRVREWSQTQLSRLSYESRYYKINNAIKKYNTVFIGASIVNTTIVPTYLGLIGLKELAVAYMAAPLSPLMTLFYGFGDYIIEQGRIAWDLKKPPWIGLELDLYAAKLSEGIVRNHLFETDWQGQKIFLADRGDKADLNLSELRDLVSKHAPPYIHKRLQRELSHPYRYSMLAFSYLSQTDEGSLALNQLISQNLKKAPWKNRPFIHNLIRYQDARRDLLQLKVDLKQKIKSMRASSSKKAVDDMNHQIRHLMKDLQQELFLDRYRYLLGHKKKIPASPNEDLFKTLHQIDKIISQDLPFDKISIQKISKINQSINELQKPFPASSLSKLVSRGHMVLDRYLDSAFTGINKTVDVLVQCLRSVLEKLK